MSDFALHTCPRLEERYYETRHKSGLRVLVSPKDFSACYATLGVGYGSRDRLAFGRVPMGTAHFLEHKMFERADGTSWEDVFSALGAEVNAYTSDDLTAYMFSATDRVPEAITALVSMATELSVTSGSVRRERSIIAEEIRMNTDDPWEVCYAEMLRGLYAPVGWGGNAVREEICGTEQSIRRVTPAVLRSTHELFYRPENMVLAVSGRITPEEVLTAVDAALGDVTPKAPKPMPDHRRFQEARGVYKSRVTVRMDTPKPLFSIGIKLSTVPDDPAALVRLERVMTVLSEALFSRSGDFYNSLFESGTVSPGMAYGSALGRPALGGSGGAYGYFYLSGECDSPEAVYAAFLAYIASVKGNGLDPAAFDRARRTLYADYIYGFDSTEGVASSLMTAAFDGVGLYDLSDLDQSLTQAELTALLTEAFEDTQYTLSSVMPNE